MKIKTQNEKIVETYKYIWKNIYEINIYIYIYIYIYEKTVIRVRKKQFNVSSCMTYLEFAFKGPKYPINLVFLLIFWQSL